MLFSKCWKHLIDPHLNTMCILVGEFIMVSFSFPVMLDFYPGTLPHCICENFEGGDHHNFDLLVDSLWPLQLV